MASYPGPPGTPQTLGRAPVPVGWNFSVHPGDNQFVHSAYQAPATGGVSPQPTHPPVTGPIPIRPPSLGGPQPGNGKGGKGQPKQPTPFDPEYYANVANFLFKTNASIARAQQTQAEDRTGLSGALAQLQAQQPHDALALEQQANHGGALYSSAYGQNLGQLAYRYAGRQTGFANTYGGRIAALAQQIAGLRGGVPLYENQQALASAERLAAAAAKNKALGERGNGDGGRSTITSQGGGGAADRHGGGRGRGVVRRTVPTDALKSRLAGGRHGR